MTKKVLVPDEKGNFFTCEAIEHDGGLWLVPKWLESPVEGVRRPARIIRMDSLPQTKLPAGWEQDSAIATSIPTGVLNCETPPEKAHGFVVIDEPDIALPLGTRGIH